MSNIYIFPCNPNLFDIHKHFSQYKTIIWRKLSDMKCGDYVFIYIGKTLMEIKYKCKVVSLNIDQNTLNNNKYAIPKGELADKCEYLELLLEKVYEDGTFPLKELKENGMGQFIVPMHAKEKLEIYLKNKDMEKLEE